MTYAGIIPRSSTYTLKQSVARDLVVQDKMMVVSSLAVLLLHIVHLYLYSPAFAYISQYYFYSFYKSRVVMLHLVAGV